MLLQALKKHVAPSLLLTKKLEFTSFSNSVPLSAQNTFFKAITHPLAVTKVQALISKLEALKSVVIYDPFLNFPALDSLYSLGNVNVTDIFVQQVTDIGKTLHGKNTKPVDQIGEHLPSAVLLLAFEGDKHLSHFRHLLPESCQIVTLDETKIPEEFLTKKDHYLQPLNFSTNFGFFREQGSEHTRISFVNYWGSYGATSARFWLCLFDEQGTKIAEWEQSMGGSGEMLVIDSSEIKKRFNLPNFTGSLYMHAQHIVAHDIIKYVCDLYNDEGTTLTVTHDSNSWPADYYSGIPAPQSGEKILLWIQNCHPIAIEAGSVAVRLMGGETLIPLEKTIAPFATYGWDLGESLPASWPAQYEVVASKYFTRPRYEVLHENGLRHISHANVERTDLAPDNDLPVASQYLGKGYILPFPVLPMDQYETLVMPTPMALSQQYLTLTMYIYDAAGALVDTLPLAPIHRSESRVFDMGTILSGVNYQAGHIELAYNPAHLSDADGWLHALVRYRRKDSGQTAETSFGAHIYNIPVVYKNEPQSYKGNPPGLRTTLILRSYGAEDTFCQLIYPCSKTWLPTSSTDLILYTAGGKEIVRKRIAIPMNGSHFFTVNSTFSQEQRASAGEKAYVIIKDTTCRLFGFHGQTNDSKQRFSIDHMFGF